MVHVDINRFFHHVRFDALFDVLSAKSESALIPTPKSRGGK